MAFFIIFVVDMAGLTDSTAEQGPHKMVNSRYRAEKAACDPLL